MKVLLAALLLATLVPLGAPTASACHPEPDPDAPAWVWASHGCGGGQWRACVRVGDETTCYPS